MKIKLSKSQWEKIGKNQGWNKKADVTTPSNPERDTLLRKYAEQIVEYKDTMGIEDIIVYLELAYSGGWSAGVKQYGGALGKHENKDV